jgi:tRNA (cmo5U34)-methyltransferase
MPTDGTSGREWHEEARVARYGAMTVGAAWWDASERALIENLPDRVGRVLDIGTGDGRLIRLVRSVHPRAAAVGLDFSPPMLAAAERRFAGASPAVELVVHDLAQPLPDLGTFDLIVSGLAIHHLDDRRKRALYAEVHERLETGGQFLNLEHVASATPRLHAAFLDAIGEAPDDEDPSDRLVDVCDQVGWLRELGFDDADCHWKWRELALFGGRRR